MADVKTPEQMAQEQMKRNLEMETAINSLSKNQCEALLLRIEHIQNLLSSNTPGNGYFVLGSLAERLASVVRSLDSAKCCKGACEAPEEPVEEVKEEAAE